MSSETATYHSLPKLWAPLGSFWRKRAFIVCLTSLSFGLSGRISNKTCTTHNIDYWSNIMILPCMTCWIRRSSAFDRPKLMIYFQWHGFWDIFLVTNWTYVTVGIVKHFIGLVLIYYCSGQQNVFIISKRFITTHLESSKCFSSCVGSHFLYSVVSRSEDRLFTYFLSLPFCFWPVK